MVLTRISAPTGYAPTGVAFPATMSLPTVPIVADIAGTIVYQLTLTDGCNTPVITTFTINIQCPGVNTKFNEPTVINVLPQNVIMFSDNQTTRLDVDPPALVIPAFLLTDLAFSYTVISAPSNSIYFAYNYSNITTTTANTFLMIKNTTHIVTYNTTSTTTLTTQNSRFASLTASPLADPDMMWPTCFRPDVPGSYVVQVAYSDSHIPLSQCPARTITTMINMTCPANTITVNLNPSHNLSYTDAILQRKGYMHFALNATATGTSNMTLYYVWQQMDSLNSFNGKTTPAEIQNVVDGVAYVTLTSTSETFVFNVTVSDGCNVQYRYYTISPSCDAAYSAPKSGVVVSAGYDGSIPIPMMTIQYDYPAYINSLGINSAASCERIYSWNFIDYTPAVIPGALPETGPTFVGSAGFIALVVIVPFFGLLAIIGLGLYLKRRSQSETK